MQNHSANSNGRILSLDVGDKRIGVASASLIARIATPLLTLQVKDIDKTLQDIANLIKAEDVVMIVIGLPRDMKGNETAQTASVRAFADKLKKLVDVPINFQDEALTSVKAEAELAKRKKSNARNSRNASSSDVDSLAATYILEDFMESGIL